LTAVKEHWLLKVELIAFAVIMLIAAYLRVGQPGIVEFKRDEANLSQLALDFVHGGELPLLGIGSSVRVPNSPISVYILSIPYFLTDSPQFATQFIALLNIIAIAITYWLARRYCGILPALIAITLFAASPWSVIFSRKIWAQDMLPLFVVLTISTGILGFIDGKKWAQITHLPLLAITTQIHYGAFIIVPVSVYLVWQGRRYINRFFVVGVVLAFISVTPFLVGLHRSGFDNFDAWRQSLSGNPESDGISISRDVLTGGIIILSGKDIHSLAGPERFLDYLAEVPDAYPIFNLVPIIVVLSASWLLMRSIKFRDSRSSVDALLLIWLIFPFVAYLVTWTPFFIHYLIPILPAAFLIIGLALNDLFTALNAHKQMKKFALLSSLTIIFLVSVLQIWLSLSLLNFVDTYNTPGGFGTPLHYLLDVKDVITKSGSGQVIADVGGQAIGFDDEPTIWDTLLYDVPHVRFEDDHTNVYPAEPALLLENNCETALQTFVLREGNGCYGLSERELNDLNDNEFMPIPDNLLRQFANGVEMLAYRWKAQERCLALVWRIHQTTSEDYMFALPFLDESGRRVAQGDGLSWFGRFWLPGDVVVREFCLADQTQDVSSVEIGMYTFDGTTFFNVELLDSNNAPAGQVIELDLS
jgi:hypothetical protein